ncbi:hypothetical protein [Pseudoalteromonas distincta]|uniref:hypothetical protein n=1 Tax=Pseudoalteromonas distincta TaxID=77608 RepID=UPI0039EAB9A3
MSKFSLTFVNLSIKTMRLCASLLLILLSNAANAENIKPFTSDGCSSFPDGTIQHKKLWLACCTAHDYAYWQGGTYKERLKADKVLQHCVANVGETNIANLMLAGVRIGGSPFIPTTFRWGYGWSYPRLYQALTADEIKQIAALKTVLTQTN